MQRQLLILRHAKSAWDTDAPSDFERPLAKRGQRDAPNIGDWLLKQKLIPDHVVSSPAERAKQTAFLVCQQLDIKKKKIAFDQRIYGAGTEDLLEVLSEIPKKTRLAMIVGHNPGLEFLYHYLVGGNHPEESYGPDAGVIKTATLVQLKMPEEWETLPARCATLLSVVNPRDL